MIHTLVIRKNLTAADFIRQEFPKASIFHEKTTDRAVRVFYVFHAITFHKIEMPADLAEGPFGPADELQLRGLATEMRKAVSCNARFVVTQRGVSVEPVNREAMMS